MERSQLLNDPEQALRIALEGHQSGIWTALPCIVQSVNWTQLTVEAQPAVQGVIVDEDGVEEFVNLPVLADVPLMFPSAGGFALTLPIAVGDEVLVVFASRCIDSWWQSGGHSNPPMEVRMHDLSDGFAYPAQMSQPKVAGFSGISTTDAQLMNASGTVYLSITATGKIGFANAVTTLKTVLNNFNSAVSTFASACASATTVAQIATAGGALATSLAAVTTAIGALLK